MIPAASETRAIQLANDTDFGLNGSVLTNDLERPYAVGRLCAGTAGHNGLKVDSIAFGGVKPSGIGGEEGLHPYLEAKIMVFDAPPSSAG